MSPTDDDKDWMVPMFTAMAAIQAHVGKQRGIRGEIECPICKGQLRFSVANVNGHIHAACSTKDCVRFMQ